MDNREVDMSPGEEAIYNYIVDRNAYYACQIIQVFATESILKKYAEQEIERFNNIEKELWKYIYKKLKKAPIIDFFSRSSLFCNVSNDILCYIDYYCSSQGCWKINPLKGNCIAIPYQEFENKIGVTKDVAKLCLKKLEERGKITKKRVMGGIQYNPQFEDIKKQMLNNPGKWKPQHFNPNIMRYEEDQEIKPLIKHAQEEMEDFQMYYLRLLKETLGYRD